MKQRVACDVIKHHQILLYIYIYIKLSSISTYSIHHSTPFPGTAVQGLSRCSNDVVPLHISTAMTGSSPSSSSSSSSSSLSIDLDESTETKIQRLITEHPVIIFTRSSCCMCHVMKKLLATIGVHPTVIELEDHEIPALPPSSSSSSSSAPAAFIGGTCIGGLESLVALHVSGLLVPKLVEVGALLVRRLGPIANY